MFKAHELKVDNTSTQTFIDNAISIAKHHFVRRYTRVASSKLFHLRQHCMLQSLRARDFFDEMEDRMLDNVECTLERYINEIIERVGLIYPNTDKEIDIPLILNMLDNTLLHNTHISAVTETNCVGTSIYPVLKIYLYGEDEPKQIVGDVIPNNILKR